MPSNALHAFRTELHEQLASLQPRLKGLQGLARLSLKGETKQVIERESGLSQRRMTLIESTLQALEKLEKDGYPEIAQPAVLADIYQELQEHLEMQMAAFGQFTKQPDPNAIPEPSLGDLQERALQEDTHGTPESRAGRRAGRPDAHAGA